MIDAAPAWHGHGRMTVMKIYSTIDRTSELGRKRHLTQTARVISWHQRTPIDAWRREVEFHESLGSPGRLRDPANFIIVGIVLTGEIDDRGAHVGHYDWSDVHDPQALPEVLAAERAKAAD